MELQGKIIAFLGDSITEGIGVKDRVNNRYDNVLRRTCELKDTYNYGVSGTRIAHQQVPTPRARHDLYFCGRAYDMHSNADIVVVYGGINDYLHGDAPFGEIGDTTPATFCGGVYFLMDFLKNSKYVGKPVVFLTPARCCFNGNSDLKVSPNPIKKPDAKPSLAYVEVIQKTAAQFGIPVLDLYHDLGIDPNNDDDRVKYTADGLHFNDAGHAVLAEKVKAFLESL